MSRGPHAESFVFAHTAQELALVWLEPDPLRRLPQIWRVLERVPVGDSVEDGVAVAVIVRRIAEAFVRYDRESDMAPTARHRRGASDRHSVRALQCICHEFHDVALDLDMLASRCGLSAPYISHLLTARTGYGCRTHLHGVRLLHASYLLANTTLFIQEIATKAGYSGTAALDRDFRKWLHITPTTFRRWVV